MISFPSAGVLALVATLLGGPAAAAGPVPFDQSWQEQRFPRLAANSYAFRGKTLGLRSEGAVSLAWRGLDASFWSARQAEWDWQVDAGTPPTDLTRKGGDDRNIALYFVFVPRDRAEDASESSLRRLLRDRDARVLVYVWGGAHDRNQMLDSPYLGDRGKTVVLRPSGSGAHRETVDLAGDYARAFGGSPGALVGLAVSGDSDDTDSRIDARIDNLVLR